MAMREEKAKGLVPMEKWGKLKKTSKSAGGNKHVDIEGTAEFVKLVNDYKDIVRKDLLAKGRVIFSTRLARILKFQFDETVERELSEAKRLPNKSDRDLIRKKTMQMKDWYHDQQKHSEVRIIAKRFEEAGSKVSFEELQKACDEAYDNVPHSRNPIKHKQAVKFARIHSMLLNEAARRELRDGGINEPTGSQVSYKSKNLRVWLREQRKKHTGLRTIKSLIGEGPTLDEFTEELQSTPNAKPGTWDEPEEEKPAAKPKKEDLDKFFKMIPATKLKTLRNNAHNLSDGVLDPNYVVTAIARDINRLTDMDPAYAHKVAKQILKEEGSD